MGTGGGGEEAWNLNLDYKGKTPISEWREQFSIIYFQTARPLSLTSPSISLSVASLSTLSCQHPPAAISSYITIHNSFIYSIGGPTGEVHSAPPSSSSSSSSTSPTSNGFGPKKQEMVYVDPEKLDEWDKTNKALVSVAVT